MASGGSGIEGGASAGKASGKGSGDGERKGSSGCSGGETDIESWKSIALRIVRIEAVDLQ